MKTFTFTLLLSVTIFGAWCLNIAKNSNTKWDTMPISAEHCASMPAMPW
jgi:hypothetical protein